MKIHLAIIGLGQIGASVGLALGEHPELVFRVGHDREIGIARRAEKMGALDRVEANLPGAVRAADLVLLSLPVDQIQTTLASIAPVLKEGAVVMDTGPVKEVVAGWAADLLPPGRFYVGLTPVLNPLYLHDFDLGIDAAHPDLLRGGLVAIVSSPDIPSGAIKLAADLTRLLGASPLFADPLEIDGLMSATHILPQLMSAALLNLTVDQPGWQEGRKLAGRAYAEVSGPILHATQPQSLRSSAILNREHVLRALGGLITVLQSIRDEVIAGDSEALDERLERARRGRETWWKQRQSADWVGEQIPQPELPSASQWFGKMLGIRGKKDKIE